MAVRTIIGVDFSGSKKDDVPWITTAVLEGESLILVGCAPITRKQLKEHLLALRDHVGNSSTVVGLDFPFGVSNGVFPNLVPGNYNMMQVWYHVSKMTIEQFKALSAQHNANTRKFDTLNYRRRQSPQNVRMWRMTYHGIRLLKELHDRRPDRWHIPPLHQGKARNSHVTLLEVHPGAALNAQCLEPIEYKTNKGPRTLNNFRNRHQTLNNLPDAFGIQMPNFGDYHNLCLFNDDALDSIVAAIVAAKWSRGDPFQYPSASMCQVARLEGCFYVPAHHPPH